MRDRRSRLGQWLGQAGDRHAAKTGKKVAVIGSGLPAWPARSSSRAPATTSIVYEKFARAGGLLRYGIPDFKMEKHIIDRRVAQMEAEGVTLPLRRPCRRQHCRRVDPRELLNQYDAVVADRRRREPRDLPIPGRELDGIHFAMDFLPQQNRRVAGEPRDWRRRHPRRRQACRRDRRRRHRLGLHRHLVPAGRAIA